MINYLKIKGFGPHKEREFEFGPGVTLFIGENGSGKSNIVRAFGWAVQGTKMLPSEINQEEIINDEADEADVETEVELVGDTYIFHRNYNGNSVEAEVYRDGDLVADSSSGVSAFLSSTSLDWHAFSVLCSRQRQLDEFVFATPSERKRIFDSLLRTELVEAARKLGRSRARDAEIEYPEILDEDRDELCKRNEEIQGSIKENKADLKDLKDSLKDLQEKLKVKREEFSEASRDDNREKREELIQSISSLKTEIKSLERKAKKSDKSPEKLKASIESNEELLDGAREEYRSLQSDYEDIKDKISHLQGRHDTFLTLSDELDECPECGYPIGQSLKENDASDIQTQIRELRERQKKTEAQRDELKDAATELKEHNQSLQSQLQEAEDAIEAKELLKEKQESLNSLQSQLKNIKQSSVNEDEVEQLKKDISSLETDIDNLQDKANNTQEEIIKKEYELKEAQERIEEYDEAKDRYKKSQDKVSLWKDTTDHLTHFRNKLLKDALSWVSHRATQLLHQFGNYPELDQDAKLVIDTDLRFILRSGDKEVPVYRFSGGQTAVFSIFLRVALSEYLANRLGMSGLLLLDAALDSVDSDNTAVVSNILNDLDLKQVLIFSHQDLPELEAKRIYLERQ